jgi:hypothetical protein
MRLDPTRALQDCGAHAEHIPFAFTPSSCRQSASAHYYLLLYVHYTQYIFIQKSRPLRARRNPNKAKGTFFLFAHMFRGERAKIPGRILCRRAHSIFTPPNSPYIQKSTRKPFVSDGEKNGCARSLAEKRIRGNGAVMPKPVSNEAKHLRS